LSKRTDVSAIRGVERAWCEAWNAHDVKALTDLLLPDADFVTVTGKWLHGRQEFFDHTKRLHETQFKNSAHTVSRTEVRFLNPDLGVAHVRWGLRGDTEPDGTPRKPRTGIFTQVLRKSAGKWLIVASQNTNDRILPGMGKRLR
jgi:uncharacterized protein (TIGR02246 family)